MSTIKLTGQVVAIGAEQTFSSGFKKVEVVIDDSANPKYPNPIPVEFAKDKIAQARALKVGDEVTVDAYVNGRAWTPQAGPVRYFLSLSAYGVEKAGQPAPEPRAKVEDYAGLNPDDDDSDTLPF